MSMLGVLRQNLGLKIFALVLAYMVWAFLSNPDEQVRDIDVPLDIEVAPTMVVVEKDHQQVGVRVRGSGAYLARLEESRVNARISLRDVQEPGPRVEPLLPEHIIGLPRGVVVDEILTQDVSVVLEPRIDKYVPVKGDIVEPKTPGFELVGSRTDPSTVLVRGPRSLVEGIAQLSTETIDLSARTSSGTATVRIVRPVTARRLTFPRGDEVRVRYVIREIGVDSRFEVDVVVPNGAERVVPPRVTVYLQCPRDLCDRVGRTMVVRPVTEGLGSPGGERSLLVAWPELSERERERIRVVRIEPETVTVEAAR